MTKSWGTFQNMLLPPLRKGVDLRWPGSLFRSIRLTAEAPLGAPVYSFFFSFCLSSLLISLLAMDVYFVMMPCWFIPGKSSRKLTAERGRALRRTGAPPKPPPPPPPTRRLAYSDILFLAAPERRGHMMSPKVRPRAQTPGIRF